MVTPLTTEEKIGVIADSRVNSLTFLEMRSELVRFYIDELKKNTTIEEIDELWTFWHE